MNKLKTYKIAQNPFCEDLLSTTATPTAASGTVAIATTETDPSIAAYCNGILYYECEDDNDDGDASGDDSSASLETMSDNVSVWVDGEKHWVSGVDANTTCADLISALVNYQDAAHLLQTATATTAPTAATAINQNVFTKEDNTNNTNNNNNNNNKIPNYVIVKQHRHCEVFIDSNTKIFDILPPREFNGKKEFELFLRRIEENSSSATTKNFSMMDKDSGMGSPVGSSRSAKFRRKKHKVANWLAQGNTLHPKSQKTSNERLMKIILAQDETIHRQLSLLRDKDHQITKIEEENHKIREKELGKNYLLETYLNGLGEQDICEEIFVDEPFQSPLLTFTSYDGKRKQKPIEEGDENNFAIKTKFSDNNQHQMDNKNAKELSDDIELKIMWMEKVIGINKQLQKEEEILLKIFSKIRKYHVKCAYVTKREMMQQILKIDSDIALQHADIKQVENSLLMSNEQLKQKLHVLENLSREFLEFDDKQVEQQQQQFGNVSLHPGKERLISDSTNATIVPNLQSPEDLAKLHKLISKPTNNNSPKSRRSDTSTVSEIDVIICERQRSGDGVDNGSELIDCTSKNTKPANVPHSKTIQKQMFTANCPLNDIQTMGTLV